MEPEALLKPPTSPFDDGALHSTESQELGRQDDVAQPSQAQSPSQRLAQTSPWVPQERGDSVVLRPHRQPFEAPTNCKQTDPGPHPGAPEQSVIEGCTALLAKIDQ